MDKSLINALNKQIANHQAQIDAINTLLNLNADTDTAVFRMPPGDPDPGKAKKGRRGGGVAKTTGKTRKI